MQRIEDRVEDELTRFFILFLGQKILLFWWSLLTVESRDSMPVDGDSARNRDDV